MSMTPIRIVKHFLREVADLCNYGVVESHKPLGSLTGLVFDPKSWRVEQFQISTLEVPDEPVFAPVQAFRSLDDEHRQLKIDLAGGPLVAPAPDSSKTLAAAGLADTSSLIGHTVNGRDGPVGKVIDLLVNVDLWQLRYLVIESETGHALTDIEWCVSVGDGEQPPRIDLPAKAIAMAPPYRDLHEICSGYEAALYRHYTSRAYAGNGRIA